MTPRGHDHAWTAIWMCNNCGTWDSLRDWNPAAMLPRLAPVGAEPLILAAEITSVDEWDTARASRDARVFWDCIRQRASDVLAAVRPIHPQRDWRQRGPPERLGQTHSGVYVPLLHDGACTLSPAAAQEWRQHPIYGPAWDGWVMLLRAAAPQPAGHLAAMLQMEISMHADLDPDDRRNNQLVHLLLFCRSHDPAALHLADVVQVAQLSTGYIPNLTQDFLLRQYGTVALNRELLDRVAEAQEAGRTYTIHSSSSAGSDAASLADLDHQQPSAALGTRQALPDDHQGPRLTSMEWAATIMGHLSDTDQDGLSWPEGTTNAVPPQIVNVAAEELGASVILASNSGHYIGHTDADNMHGPIECLQADYTGQSRAAAIVNDFPAGDVPTLLAVDTDGSTTQKLLDTLTRAGCDADLVCVTASTDIPAHCTVGPQLALLANDRWGSRPLQLATALVAMGVPWSRGRRRVQLMALEMCAAYTSEHVRQAAVHQPLGAAGPPR